MSWSARSARIGGVVVVLLIVIFLLGPLGVAIAMSFGPAPILQFPPSGFTLKWYSAVISSSAWTSPALTSLYAGLLVALVSTVLGLMASYALVRGGLRFQSILIGFLMLPLITPIIIIALGMALMLSDLRLVDSLWGLVLAQSVLAVPYVVINCTLSLRGVDRSLERAAASLGASPIRVFIRVTFPLIVRGVIAGAIFAFLSSWDDAVVALFLNGPHLTTLPVYLLEQVQNYVSPTVAAAGGYLSLVGIFMCFLIVLSGVRRVSSQSAAPAGRPEPLVAEAV